MQITVVRGIDPARLAVSAEITEEDTKKAFEDMTDPDEELYYALFGPGWNKLSDAEKFDALGAFARTLAMKRAATIKVDFMGPEKK